MQQSFENIVSKFFDRIISNLNNPTPSLFPVICATTGKITIKTNLNVPSSRSFNRKNCLQVYCKIRFEPKAIRLLIISFNPLNASVALI